MKILAKMTRLLEGPQQKSSIRTKRANGLVQWVLWSPRNALITGFSAGLVVAVGLVVVLSQYVYDYQMADYERAQQAAATPTATATANSEDYGLTKLTNTPSPTSTTPTPSTSTATAAPATTVTTAPQAPVNSDDAKAQAITRKFIAAWLAGPKADSQQAWIDGLTPTASPELIELFKLTDRTKIPTGTSIESMTSVTVPGTNTAHVSATMKGRGVLGVVLEADQTGAWKVVDVAPEDSE